jgi:hypothetical protein
MITYILYILETITLPQVLLSMNVILIYYIFSSTNNIKNHIESKEALSSLKFKIMDDKLRDIETKLEKRYKNYISTEDDDSLIMRQNKCKKQQLVFDTFDNKYKIVRSNDNILSFR